MALGRGLHSLIPPRDTTANIANQAATSVLASGAQAEVLAIPVSAIQVNPYQPRRHWSHQQLEELIQSIKQHGILQPLLVSKIDDSTYQLIAGERRLRAARIAGLATVPVIVRQVEELERLELALIENIQRSDLNPIEKAEGYRKLLTEFGLNHEEAAKKVGLSRSTFTNSLRLLDLPGDIQKAVADGQLTEGHAKILLGLPTAHAQHRYFQRIIAEQLSVRSLTAAVTGKTKRTSHSKATGQSAQLTAWQEELALALSTKVTITPKQIQLDYYSAEELGRLVGKLTR